MENQLIIEQLKAESELKTKWLSLIAHDFRGMFSSLNWLLNAYEDKVISQDVFLSMLPEIKQIAKQNSKTLESTINWVKSQSEGFNPQIEDVSLYNLFEALKEELKQQLILKKINLKYVGNKEAHIKTDRFLFSFILKQTLDNAVKYTQQGGEIKFVFETDSHTNIILIKDDGLGMCDTVLEGIGTLNGSPYSGSMKEKGAGLSLVIVKDFVEMLNGEMNFTSAPHKGTCVEFKLPF